MSKTTINIDSLFNVDSSYFDEELKNISSTYTFTTNIYTSSKLLPIPVRPSNRRSFDEITKFLTASSIARSKLHKAFDNLDFIFKNLSNRLDKDLKEFKQIQHNERQVIQDFQQAFYSSVQQFYDYFKNVNFQIDREQTLIQDYVFFWVKPVSNEGIYRQSSIHNLFLTGLSYIFGVIFSIQSFVDYNEFNVFIEKKILVFINDYGKNLDKNESVNLYSVKFDDIFKKTGDYTYTYSIFYKYIEEKLDKQLGPIDMDKSFDIIRDIYDRFFLLCEKLSIVYSNRNKIRNVLQSLYRDIGMEYISLLNNNKSYPLSLDPNTMDPKAKNDFNLVYVNSLNKSMSLVQGISDRYIELLKNRMTTKIFNDTITIIYGDYFTDLATFNPGKSHWYFKNCFIYCLLDSMYIYQKFSYVTSKRVNIKGYSIFEILKTVFDMNKNIDNDDYSIPYELCRTIPSMLKNIQFQFSYLLLSIHLNYIDDKISVDPISGKIELSTLYLDFVKKGINMKDDLYISPESNVYVLYNCLRNTKLFFELCKNYFRTERKSLELALDFYLNNSIDEKGEMKFEHDIWILFILYNGLNRFIIYTQAFNNFWEIRQQLRDIANITVSNTGRLIDQTDHKNVYFSLIDAWGNVLLPGLFRFVSKICASPEKIQSITKEITPLYLYRPSGDSDLTFIVYDYLFNILSHGGFIDFGLTFTDVQVKSLKVKNKIYAISLSDGWKPSQSILDRYISSRSYPLILYKNYNPAFYLHTASTLLSFFPFIRDSVDEFNSNDILHTLYVGYNKYNFKSVIYGSSPFKMYSCNSQLPATIMHCALNSMFTNCFVQFIESREYLVSIWKRKRSIEGKLPVDFLTLTYYDWLLHFQAKLNEIFQLNMLNSNIFDNANRSVTLSKDKTKGKFIPRIAYIFSINSVMREKGNGIWNHFSNHMKPLNALLEFQKQNAKISIIDKDFNMKGDKIEIKNVLFIMDVMKSYVFKASSIMEYCSRIKRFSGLYIEYSILFDLIFKKIVFVVCLVLSYIKILIYILKGIARGIIKNSYDSYDIEFRVSQIDEEYQNILCLYYNMLREYSFDISQNHEYDQAENIFWSIFLTLFGNDLLSMIKDLSVDDLHVHITSGIADIQLLHVILKLLVFDQVISHSDEYNRVRRIISTDPIIGPLKADVVSNEDRMNEQIGLLKNLKSMYSGFYNQLLLVDCRKLDSKDFIDYKDLHEKLLLNSDCMFSLLTTKQMKRFRENSYEDVINGLNKRMFLLKDDLSIFDQESMEDVSIYSAKMRKIMSDELDVTTRSTINKNLNSVTRIIEHLKLLQTRDLCMYDENLASFAMEGMINVTQLLQSTEPKLSPNDVKQACELFKNIPNYLFVLEGYNIENGFNEVQHLSTAISEFLNFKILVDKTANDKYDTLYNDLRKSLDVEADRYIEYSGILTKSYNNVYKKQTVLLDSIFVSLFYLKDMDISDILLKEPYMEGLFQLSDKYFQSLLEYICFAYEGSDERDNMSYFQLLVNCFEIVPHIKIKEDYWVVMKRFMKKNIELFSKDISLFEDHILKLLETNEKYVLNVMLICKIVATQFSSFMNSSLVSSVMKNIMYLKNNKKRHFIFHGCSLFVEQFTYIIFMLYIFLIRSSNRLKDNNLLGKQYKIDEEEFYLIFNKNYLLKAAFDIIDVELNKKSV